MNREKLTLTTEFLTIQLNHWTLFLPAMTVMGLAAGLTGSRGPDWGMWALAGLLPFLCFLIRSRRWKFVVFCGAHLALLALSLLIPAADILSRILCILYAAYCLIQSFAVRLKEDVPSAAEAFSPAAVVSVAAASFLLNHFQGIREWERFYFFPLIGCLTLYNVVSYLERYQEFLERHKTTAGTLPAAEMLRSGLPPVLGYTLFGAAVMLLGVNLTWLEELAVLFKKGLFALLRAFFSLFFPKEGGQTEAVQEQPVLPTVGETPPLPTAERPFWLWRVLETVVAIVILCGLLYAIARLLIFLVKYIRERFSESLVRRKADEDEACADHREKCLPERERKTRGKALPGFLSPEARIRRLYKKKLLTCSAELSGSGRLPFLTARDCEEKLKLNGMAAYYERARYSEEKLTRQDVRGMQDACAGRFESSEITVREEKKYDTTQADTGVK